MDAMLIFPRKWFVPPDTGIGLRPVRDEIDALCQNINGPSICQNSRFFPEKYNDAKAVPCGQETARLRDMPHNHNMDLLPSVDLQYLEDVYIMTVELPGVPPEKVLIQVYENCLSISGEKRQRTRDNAQKIVSECVYGSFRRMWTLPEDAEGDAVSVMHRNGVLTIIVPRKTACNNAYYGKLKEN